MDVYKLCYLEHYINEYKKRICDINREIVEIENNMKIEESEFLKNKRSNVAYFNKNTKNRCVYRITNLLPCRTLAKHMKIERDPFNPQFYTSALVHI